MKLYIAKLFGRIKKEWKSFCYEGDDALIYAFKLLQTSNISILKTPEQIKIMFQDLLSAKSKVDCNESQAASITNKKRLSELNNPSYKWKTNNTRLTNILEGYEFSGMFKIVF